jgi:hypothetical protein
LYRGFEDFTVNFFTNFLREEPIEGRIRINLQINPCSEGVILGGKMGKAGRIWTLAKVGDCEISYAVETVEEAIVKFKPVHQPKIHQEWRRQDTQGLDPRSDRS